MKTELVNEPEQIVDILKGEITIILSTTYNELNNMLIDEVEEEKLNASNRMMNLKLIDEVKVIKHNLFSDILKTYNELIIEKNSFDSKIKLENKESEQIKEELNSSMKRTLIFSAGTSILLPGFIPLVLIIGIPRLGADKLMKDYHTRRIEENNHKEYLFKRVQEPLYELTDTLRTDYHKSMKELKELETRAINGDYIMDELKEIVNPKRVGLEFMELEEKETEKVLIKEKVNI